MWGQQRRTAIMNDRWNGGENATRFYKRRLDALVRPGMALLHGGCGWDKKHISADYRDTCRVVGVDLDSRVAELFHSEFHLASLDRLPFADATFDIIFSEYVFEHVDDPGGALREMARVLKPGGRILVLTPNLFSYKTLAGALTPYGFHLAMGRIRYGKGHEPDMYPTRYRCNTVGAFRRLGEAAGLGLVSASFVTNGPTWFARFPLVFEAFDVFHRLLERFEVLKALRCGLLVELKK